MDSLLVSVALERGDWEVTLDKMQRLTHEEREKYATNPEDSARLFESLWAEAMALEELGRLDEALALDAEWEALNPGNREPAALVRSAKKHMAEGEDAEAEQILRDSLRIQRGVWHVNHSSKQVEHNFRRECMLAELLERRGTEEALAEARTLRDEVAKQLAEHEASRAAALDETRAAAVAAVRQWRHERSKVSGKKQRGQVKGKKKSKKKSKSKPKAKGKGASPAATIGGGGGGAARANRGGRGGGCSGGG
jgi:tetratricopeptide (TPR) repeat protein